MIYLVTTGHAYTIYHLLRSWARHFSGTLKHITYADLLRKQNHSAGVYIFVDLERLNFDTRARIIELWERLERSKGPFICLNNLAHSKCRYELLRTLHDRKLNSYNVYRLDESLDNIKFPVFLRRADDHNGPQTELIHNWRTLDKVIERIGKKATESGEWIVVEYIDTKDDNGVFRKYAAFIIDDAVLPRHVLFGLNWVVKVNTNENVQDFINEEWEYLNENPHCNQLREIFEIGRISYGRIDYGLLNAQIQVWEINTNPIVFSADNFHDPHRRRNHNVFANKFNRELINLMQKIPQGAEKTLSGRIAWRSNIETLKYKAFVEETTRPVRQYWGQMLFLMRQWAIVLFIKKLIRIQSSVS